MAGFKKKLLLWDLFIYLLLLLFFSIIKMMLMMLMMMLMMKMMMWVICVFSYVNRFWISRCDGVWVYLCVSLCVSQKIFRHDEFTMALGKGN